MPICKAKGREVGLWYEIKIIEDIIKSKESRGEDVSFEKRILKSHRKYSEKDYAVKPILQA